MLWFEPFPWGRWVLVVLVALVAAYVEFKPDNTVEAPFATSRISPGDVVDETNTELRTIPTGLLDSAERGDVATRAVLEGSPVMATDVGDQGETVPPGWWVVGVTLPDGSDVGDDVRLVILDTGEQVDGVVASPGVDDPFAAADGGVAVPPDKASDVAMGAANGRLAVLISTG